MSAGYAVTMICPVCANDDAVNSAKLAPGIFQYTCSAVERHPKSEPLVWERDTKGASLPAWGGVMGELGLFQDLPQCLVQGEPPVEYGVVEHRYERLFPQAFAAVLQRYPHRRDQQGLGYTASAFIAAALSRLQGEGVLTKKFGKATGSWAYDGEVSYWALPPAEGLGPDITWKEFAVGEGIEP
jgi:hypothetical protein